jgi:uncharacterized protein
MKLHCLHWESCRGAAWLTALLFWSLGTGFGAQATPAYGVAPNFVPVLLKQGELGGEIGRRVELTIEKNFLALDLERYFVAPFRNRRPPEELVKRFGDNAVELGENLHAAVWFAHYSANPLVIERKDWLLNETLKTQSASGYIGVFEEEANGRQMFRNYSFEEAAFLVLALTDDFRCFAHQTSLAAARRLADYLMNAYAHRPAGIKFSSLASSLSFLALYEATREPRYLAFAADEPGGALFIDPAPLRKWKQEIYPTRALDYEGSRKVTRVLPAGLYPDYASYTFPTDRVHMYSLIERAVSQLRLNRIEPNDHLLGMPTRILDGITDGRRPAMVITGASGWHEGWNEDQDGRGPLGETCASVALIDFSNEWLRLRGDLRFGDLMERIVYNTLFAAQEPAGRRLRYFTAFSGERRYFELDTYCCPGNFRRGIAALPSFVYYRMNDGLAVNLFSTSSVNSTLASGVAVKLEQKTNYPASGDIDITVSPSRREQFVLKLRIPRWAEGATVTLNGQNPVTPGSGAAFFEIKREWRAGDRVQLRLPMPWRLVKGLGMQTDRVALMRGPIVYGLSPARNPGQAGQKLRDLVLDPRSSGAVEPDATVRPDGTCVRVKASRSGAPTSPATEELVFTEFTDPTVGEIYFRAPKNVAVDDELLRRGRALVPDTLRFPNEEQLAP